MRSRSLRQKRSGVASDEQPTEVTVERVPGPQSGHWAPSGSCEGVGQHGGISLTLRFLDPWSPTREAMWWGATLPRAGVYGGAAVTRSYHCCGCLQSQKSSRRLWCTRWSCLGPGGRRACRRAGLPHCGGGGGAGAGRETRGPSPRHHLPRGRSLGSGSW